MIEVSDPTKNPAPLSRGEMLTAGVDGCRHPLFPGCILSQNGTSPGDQARNFLRSIFEATVQQIAGRKCGDLSETEYLDCFRKLEAWEQAGNTVRFPPRVVSADHPHVHPAPKLTPSQIGEAVAKAALEHAQSPSAAKH